MYSEDSTYGRRELMRIELTLDLSVHNLFSRRDQLDVHIILASSNHL